MRRGATTLLFANLAVWSSLACAREAVASGSVDQASSIKGVRCASQQEVDAALGKAAALLEQSHYPDAIRILEPYTKARCDPRVYLLMAAAYEFAANLAGAEGTLTTAHAVWPANTSIAASLAREYMKDGQTDKALGALSSFQVTSTTPLQEMQEGVVVYLAGHRLAKAQTVAETAYKGYPSLATLLLLANVYQLEGRYKDVNRMLGEQRNAYGDSPNFLITLAESESDAMLFDAASADLEHALAIDNKSYQAHYLLGNVMAAENKAEQAEVEYRTAIELAPSQPRTYFHLALIFRDRQDEAKEETLLGQALAADSHYAPAYCEMGRILIERHHLADAMTQLNLAIRYNPQLEQSYYLMARAYAGSGQKEKADAMVKQYTTLRTAHRHSALDTRPGQLGVDTGGQ